MMPRHHRLPCCRRQRLFDAHECPRHHCHRHCHCHRVVEQGTGDDAKASLPALLLLLTRMSVRRYRCHCHCAGKQGTGDDAKASSSAMLPSSMCTSLLAAAAAAIARTSKGQVMVLRHHRPPCRRLHCATLLAVPPSSPPRGRTRDR